MKKEVTPSRNDAIHVTGSQTSAEAVRPPSQLRFVPRGAIDNDTNPLNQVSFDLDNIVAVAATTRADPITDWSSCGATTVDLGAPGEEIFSCAHTTDSSYKFLNGASMATPHVVGACALLWPRYPSSDRVLSTTDPLAQFGGQRWPLDLQTALLSTNGITSNSANGPVLSSPAATTDVK